MCGLLLSWCFYLMACVDKVTSAVDYHGNRNIDEERRERKKVAPVSVR